jgi:hypothetical protein
MGTDLSFLDDSVPSNSLQLNLGQTFKIFFVRRNENG